MADQEPKTQAATPELSTAQEALPTTLEEAHREILALRERVANLEQAVAELKANEDRLRRAAAHYDNLRKQAERKLEEEIRYGAERILKKLLPVKDDLERALEATKDSNNVEAIREGVQMVLKAFDELLQSEGVTPIEAIGKPFDPRLHEAFAQHETSEHPAHHVISEVRKGYLLNDRLLRPSGVLVAVPPEGEPAAKDPQGAPPSSKDQQEP
ncbi:MAG: hypothetical protein KatS3mg115_1785 [Candidatus Poribacteria bacterium]|nr:MAG: hypothetical protein KatS3mg115_1785 [Candidatus Poribacteria bacterium]